MQGVAYLEARCVAKVCLRRLRVIEGTVSDCTIRGTDRKTANIELIATAVAVLGSLVHNLYRAE